MVYLKGQFKSKVHIFPPIGTEFWFLPNTTKPFSTSLVVLKAPKHTFEKLNSKLSFQKP